MRKTIFILILAFVLGGALEAEAQTDQQVSVRINRQKTVARNALTIRFVSLTEDSRCPTDANCVWAGNAKIKILVVRRNGAARTFELNTNLKPQVITYAGYEIKLIDLTPKPATNIRINRNGYTATMNVRRIG